MHPIAWLNVPGYTGETWNPITGCYHASPGCDNCYAEKMAVRQKAMRISQYQTVTTGKKWNGKVYFHEPTLRKPLRWKTPRLIFVESMADLFYDGVTVEWIDKIMAVIAQCPQHKFMILTKRPMRMWEYFRNLLTVEGAERFEDSDGFLPLGMHHFSLMCRRGTPLPNLCLGVTCENQAMANERIPYLLATPAAQRFVSVEPMLSAVNFGQMKIHEPYEEYYHCYNCYQYFIPNLWTCGQCDKDTKDYKDGDTCECGNTDVTEEQNVPCPDCHSSDTWWACCLEDESLIRWANMDRIDYIIAGCESGPGHRPMELDWIRSIRDQCNESGTPFMFKQAYVDGKKTKMPELDGVVYDAKIGEI